MSADLQSSGTSWLIPIGVGVNCALNQPLSLTPIFLLNFTDVDAGRGTGATVMPGLTVAPSFLAEPFSHTGGNDWVGS